MTILLVTLKILGAALLILLLLLLAALLLPLGLDIRYAAGQWQVQARYALLHFALYPPKSAPQQAASLRQSAAKVIISARPADYRRPQNASLALAPRTFPPVSTTFSIIFCTFSRK